MNFSIANPLPWYAAGPLIGVMVPALLVLSNKQLGISASFKHICAAVIPGKKPTFFNYPLKEEGFWLILFVIGMIFGGLLADYTSGGHYAPQLSESTLNAIRTMGLATPTSFQPEEIFSFDGFLTFRGFLFLAVGGFLVGFGTRYANGCTSGHAIMGLSLLNFGSLLAVIGFFTGGLIMVHLIFPFIF